MCEEKPAQSALPPTSGYSLTPTQPYMGILRNDASDAQYETELALSCHALDQDTSILTLCSLTLTSNIKLDCTLI